MVIVVAYHVWHYLDINRIADLEIDIMEYGTDVSQFQSHSRKQQEEIFTNDNIDDFIARDIITFVWVITTVYQSNIASLFCNSA